MKPPSAYYSVLDELDEERWDSTVQFYASLPADTLFPPVLTNDTQIYLLSKPGSRERAHLIHTAGRNMDLGEARLTKEGIDPTQWLYVLWPGKAKIMLFYSSRDKVEKKLKERPTLWTSTLAAVVDVSKQAALQEALARRKVSL